MLKVDLLYNLLVSISAMVLADHDLKSFSMSY